MISINDIVNLAVYGGKYHTIIIACNEYSSGISFSLKDLDRINPEMLDFPVNAILPSDTVNNGLELVVDDVHFEKINRIRN